MTEDKIARAIEYSNNEGFYIDSFQPVSEEEVGDFERSIGQDLPESYRKFLLTFGSGGIEDIEIYGLIPGNPDHPAIPNTRWYTEDLRRQQDLPHGLVAIESLGPGNTACIRLSGPNNDGRADIVLWDDGRRCKLEELRVLAPDFGSYFLDRVMQL